MAAELVEGMRPLGERGEAVRNEGQEGAECRVRGQKERSWAKRKRTQFGNVYALQVRKKRGQRKRKRVQSIQEDLQVSFRHNPNNMKCGRPVRQGARRARAIGKADLVILQWM